MNAIARAIDKDPGWTLVILGAVVLGLVWLAVQGLDALLDFLARVLPGRWRRERLADAEGRLTVEATENDRLIKELNALEDKHEAQRVVLAQIAACTLAESTVPDEVMRRAFKFGGVAFPEGPASAADIVPAITDSNGAPVAELDAARPAEVAAVEPVKEPVQ